MDYKLQIKKFSLFLRLISENCRAKKHNQKHDIAQ
jgi:hypothetical protein